MQTVQGTMIDGEVASGDHYGPIISTQGITRLSVQAVLAGAGGSPDIDVTILVSNEESNPSLFTALSDKVNLTSNATGFVAVDLTARWVRVRSQDTGSASGGTITVYLFGNGPD